MSGGLKMKIIQASREDVFLVFPLFIEYRNFYHLDRRDEEAKKFLEARVCSGESVVFYVEVNGEVVGFAQLYPLFCSFEMKSTWLLHDLFVVPKLRKQGVAQALLKKVDQLLVDSSSGFITLNTAVDNNAAQGLYEKNGYAIESDFLVYNKLVSF
jgi:ribosomal protein S18 acetylase RimI-like enzyme